METNIKNDFHEYDEQRERRERRERERGERDGGSKKRGIHREFVSNHRQAMENRRESLCVNIKAKKRQFSYLNFLYSHFLLYRFK